MLSWSQSQFFQVQEFGIFLNKDKVKYISAGGDALLKITDKPILNNCWTKEKAGVKNKYP